MSEQAMACVLNLADAYFGCVAGGECDQFVCGLKEELTQTANSQDFDALYSDSIDELTVLTQAACIVKSSGVYPYYITRLVAAAVHCKAKKEDELAGAIAMGGVRSAVESLYDMCLEPELSFLISQAYASILSGTFFDIDDKKLSVMKLGYEHGFKNEATYHGCAQCTIKAAYDTLKLSGEKYDYVFRAASSLAGGVAICIDSACGAYSGCNMIIGTYVGRALDSLGQETSSASASLALGQRIHDKFITTYGSVNCRNLHGCKLGRAYNLRDQDDRAEFQEAGAHDVICPTTVGIAVSWLIEVLVDEGLI